MTLGFDELIKNYRKENKLTQNEFGKLLNKTQVSISNYEKGVHFPKDIEEINLIAKVIGVPFEIVVDAIHYSLEGFVEQNQALPVELDNVDLQKHFKLIVDGEEITSEELEKMIYIIRFERFIQK